MKKILFVFAISSVVYSACSKKDDSPISTGVPKEIKAADWLGTYIGTIADSVNQKDSLRISDTLTITSNPDSLHFKTRYFEASYFGRTNKSVVNSTAITSTKSFVYKYNKQDSIRYVKNGKLDSLFTVKGGNFPVFSIGPGNIYTEYIIQPVNTDTISKRRYGYYKKLGQ